MISVSDKYYPHINGCGCVQESHCWQQPVSRAWLRRSRLSRLPSGLKDFYTGTVAHAEFHFLLLVSFGIYL